MNQQVKGIGRKYRVLLSKVLRNAKGCITVDLVHQVLHVSPSLARKYLSRWAKNGWLKRVYHGAYLPVALESEDMTSPSEDPWIIAEGLFSPCYIGGWSAAQHWDFTEQLFNETLVFSSRKLNPLSQNPGGHRFILRKTSPAKMFGFKVVWKSGVKIHVSDPHKTIIDILDDPKNGGGIRMVCDCLKSYLNSHERDLSVLMEYAFKMNNKTIFKRLGYLLSVLKYEDVKIIEQCRAYISKGNSQLDPTIKGRKLVKNWGLWVPEGVDFQ